MVVIVIGGLSVSPVDALAESCISRLFGDASIVLRRELVKISGGYTNLSSLWPKLRDGDWVVFCNLNRECAIGANVMSRFPETRRFLDKGSGVLEMGELSKLRSKDLARKGVMPKPYFMINTSGRIVEVQGEVPAKLFKFSIGDVYYLKKDFTKVRVSAVKDGRVTEVLTESGVSKGVTKATDLLFPMDDYYTLNLPFPYNRLVPGSQHRLSNMKRIKVKELLLSLGDKQDGVVRYVTEDGKEGIASLEKLKIRSYARATDQTPYEIFEDGQIRTYIGYDDGTMREKFEVMETYIDGKMLIKDSKTGIERVTDMETLAVPYRTREYGDMRVGEVAKGQGAEIEILSFFPPNLYTPEIRVYGRNVKTGERRLYFYSELH